MNKENIHLINDDCIKYMKSIDDNTFDLIVTSPPYNCEVDYNIYKDNKPWEEYESWCNEWMKECYRVLKDDGRIAVNVLVEEGILNNTKRVSPLFTFINIMQNLNFNLMGLPMWIDNHRVKYTAWGSWMSASSPYIYNPFQVVILAYKNEKKKLNKGEDTINKKDFIMGCSGVWDIRPEMSGLTKCCYPVALPKLIIELLSYKNDLVYDPFSGSGTTGVACLLTDRRYVGTEIDKDYHRIAVNRINKFYEQTALF